MTRKRKHSFYDYLTGSGKRVFALLIDPDTLRHPEIGNTLALAESSGVDLILAGGSLTAVSMDQTIEVIRRNCTVPVFLFPGNLLQLSGQADGILLLSLISGRNPDLLIGNHVLASGFLRQSGMEVIPTGYILVDGNSMSSVAYISNTQPIPASKPSIVVATAMAGELLGLKLIYLEAGSGAASRISDELVAEVVRNVSIPVFVGGGVKTPVEVRKLYQAGAAGVVVGSAVEQDKNVLPALAAVRGEFN